MTPRASCLARKMAQATMESGDFQPRFCSSVAHMRMPSVLTTPQGLTALTAMLWRPPRRPGPR